MQGVETGGKWEGRCVVIQRRMYSFPCSTLWNYLSPSFRVWIGLCKLGPYAEIVEKPLDFLFYHLVRWAITCLRFLLVPPPEVRFKNHWESNSATLRVRKLNTVSKQRVLLGFRSTPWESDPVATVIEFVKILVYISNFISSPFPFRFGDIELHREINGVGGRSIVVQCILRGMILSEVVHILAIKQYSQW